MDDERPDHVAINTAYWDGMAEQWVAAGERNWATATPTWGQWGVADEDCPLLPDDLDGQDVIELGCGTAYVSGWAARRGARCVGVDTSREQLATAERLAELHGLAVELHHASAEAVPFPDASFDLAVSEYGAPTWCDPYHWVPEAFRLLRPGGRLHFLTNHPLTLCVSPQDGSLPIGTELVADWHGMHDADWRDAADDPGGYEFNLSTGDWWRLFADTGFEVVDYREPVPPDTYEGQPFAVTAEWARRWPSEQVWWLRKPAG